MKEWPRWNDFTNYVLPRISEGGRVFIGKLHRLADDLQNENIEEV